jgi:hypothetical protein
MRQGITSPNQLCQAGPIQSNCQLINLRHLSMTNKINNTSTLSEVLEYLPKAKMDSAFENSIVCLLRTLDPESTWKIVAELLTHPKANARVLGLRVVRRQFKDKELLDRVIRLSFGVERLAELQHWYTAILARYPLKGFVRALESEAENRKDADFLARHIRALQMHQAEGNVAKKIAVAKLMAVLSRCPISEAG